MKRILPVIILLMTFILSSCTDEPDRITKQTFMLDTVINVTTDEKDADKISEVFGLFGEYEMIFSRTNPKSELYLLNHGQGNAGVEILEVIAFSAEMSRITDGAFDVTISPLVDLWDVKNRKIPPSEEEINAALSDVGYEKISLSPFSLNGRTLDTGAVAKGYIADMAAEYFRSNDVHNAIIDLGGNVVLLGEYSVGIRSPFNPDEVYATIKLKDKSAVTSGSYQRYFEYEGKRYHHIIDPRTGCPSDSGIASVTVISPSSMQADALSTAIYIMGKDSISLCNKFSDTDALIIMENGDIITTENFEKKYQLKK